MFFKHATRPGGGRWWLGCLAAALIVAAGTAHAQVTELASGLSAGIGVDLDETNNRLYYVEWTAGNLMKMELSPPGCDQAPVTCPAPALVAGGFTHPQDVAVLPDLDVAYLTTRNEIGTTGSLWRIDLTTGTPALVAFNLGAPHQIALDPLNNTAYVVAFDLGRLWRIDLTTGVKTTVTSGLDHPVGLVISADRTRAYVTEQGAANRLVEIDLTNGAKIRDVANGLTAPFYLAWSDPSEVAVYLVERDPANRLLRVDLLTGSTVTAAAGLPIRPSGVTASHLRGAAYVATDSRLVRVEVGTLPLTEPVFLGVGHVPSTSIVDGYATTDPGYFYQVRHSPFGGTLNIFGNLNNFRSAGIDATHYRVLVSANGGAFTPLSLSWNAYRWDSASGKFELTPVAPDATARYAIPPEYPTHPQRWYPSFLMMRWPSSTNGLYEFRIELWRQVGAVWNEVTASLPGGNSLVLRIDNTPPTVDLVDILHHGTNNAIAPCDIVSAPAGGGFDFRITAFDSNHHLLNYHMWVLWGKNESMTILSDSYGAHVDAEGPYWWSGVANSVQTAPAAGWTPCCDCAHTFRLRAWKRTINGYNYILRDDSHQSVTLNNTGFSCPKPGCP